MRFRKSHALWDLWCILSVIGIWPRYIEPNLLKINSLNIKIASLPPDLHGFKILHFSDLHWHKQSSRFLMKKLLKKIRLCQADLIVFTGDFICRSRLESPEELQEFLNQISAPYGCFAVWGNHDYSEFVTVNEEGAFDIEEKNESSDVLRGLKRLFNGSPLSSKLTQRVKKLSYHVQLDEMLKKTSFHILNNETRQIHVKNTKLNICGLEEYTTGRMDPQKAFEKFDENFPGIILVHHPDAAALLKESKGDLILAGHTHGGQINLPFIWKKFTRIENLDFKRGHHRLNRGKQIYINRGIASIMKFRWFSVPELTLLTLQEE